MTGIWLSSKHELDRTQDTGERFTHGEMFAPFGGSTEALCGSNDFVDR